MFEALQYDFFRNAFYAAALASILCGVLGTLVVVRRMVILAGDIAHAACGGAGLAFFMGFSPRLGAVGFFAFLALLLAWVTLKREERSDTIIGVIWTLGMAF